MKVYDIETLRGPDEVEGGWNNPEDMGFGCAVVYDTEKDHYSFYQPGEEEVLKQALIGTKHRVLPFNGVVLSFNGVKFDNSVLLGNNYDYHTCPWINIDLFIEIVMARFEMPLFSDHTLDEFIPALVDKYGAKKVFDKSCGLDAICHRTIGKRKTGHGAKAPKLIQEGRWSDVWQYNLQDVRLTWELYQFWQKHGYVIDGNDRVIRRLNTE